MKKILFVTAVLLATNVFSGDIKQCQIWIDRETAINLKIVGKLLDNGDIEMAREWIVKYANAVMKAERYCKGVGTKETQLKVKKWLKSHKRLINRYIELGYIEKSK